MVISKLLGSGKPTDIPPPRPDSVVEVVGDLHGCADLLDALPAPVPDRPRIFVGDIVDRGPDSRGVIARLRRHEAAGLGTCLMGNHEAMMLDFLDDPADAGPLWLRNGGVETLASFGATLDDDRPDERDLRQLRDDFQAALGPETESWLRARPLVWRSGTLVVTHAGADPQLPIDEQSRYALLWGHRNFPSVPRRDGLWIAHGHRIVDSPVAEAGRIATDTGAFAYGRLTLARITPEGEISFVTVTAR